MLSEPAGDEQDLTSGYVCWMGHSSLLALRMVLKIPEEFFVRG